MRRRLAALAIMLGTLVAGLLALAPQASAHAVVVSSSPADGSRLAKAPTSVSVKFDEAVGLDPGYLRVVDSAGRRVDVGSAVHPNGDGSTVSVTLKQGLGNGSYLASFRVVSADSHPVAGSINFVVGNGPLGAAAEPSAGTPVNGAVSALLAVSHWLSFAGVGLVGGSWLIFSVWPAGQRWRAVVRAVWSGWLVAAIGAIGEFVLQGPYAAGTGLSTALNGSLLDATLHINAGQLLSLRLVLLGVLGIVLTALLAPEGARRPSWGPEAAAIVGVGIVVTFAATGHSQSENPRWLAVVIDSLHLGAMVVWLGGLAILVTGAIATRRRVVAYAYTEDLVEVPSGGDAFDDPEPEVDDPDAVELAAGLPVFSRVALASVAVLAVTGTIQAWREIGALDAITSTTYGRLVIAKVVLFFVLVGLGWFARRAVQQRDWSADRPPLQRMRRTLTTEVIVGVAVLAVTAVLISQPPGKVALAAQHSRTVSARVAVTGTEKATVALTPGTHGPESIEITLDPGLTPTSITATASLPSKSLGPIAVPLQASGPHSFTGSGVVLPSAGDWQITVTVQTSTFDSTTAVATVHLW